MERIVEYQEFIKKFAIYPKDQALSYLALGLASEVGEVTGKLKKLIRDNGSVMSDEQRRALKAELGDVAWYLFMLGTEMGLDMAEVLEENVIKLEGRLHRGKLGGSGDNR
jgi:NTP pyrophosphatase (non-canonical NTP hydrolase)